mgnify:CR=1 FL=1
MTRDRAPRLLVVEDNDTNMMIFRDLLVTEGYEVREATTAEAAFAVARSEPIDLILMDVQLPGMDGIEAVRVLRNDPCTREIPIVAVSAHALAPHSKRALEAGCIGYVTKPIRSRDFRERVRSYLGSRV